jgi:hypothetical protein
MNKNTSPAPALRARADIPNAAGLLLVLVRADGSRQLARVAVDPETGCHYCATPSGKRVDLTGRTDERSPVAGWLPYPPETPDEVPGMRPAGSPHLLTREQVTQWGALHGVTCEIPENGKTAALVAFPGCPPVSLARITKTDDTKPRPLWALQFYAKSV